MTARGRKLLRLWRSHFGSAFDRDRTRISRESLSGINSRLFDRARRLLLAGRDTGGKLVDGSRYLLLTGSDLRNTLGLPDKRMLDALPHRVEIPQHYVELLVVGVGGGRCSQRVRRESFLRCCC
jgi:hypothetical protein